MSSKEFQKRKRKAVGTPDPDAEVVSLAAEKLLESERYVCENCNRIFQRDQNLQMHRRRHEIDWKLVKREEGLIEARKKVFVCPEPSCLHHKPCHALSDLVGIKKHFRRKHSDHKQWACDRCSKSYAVQSDYKAHLKTCGTRGHSCDCGRVFSRVENFIEHQDSCKVTCHEESFSIKSRHTILHPPASKLQLMPATRSNSLPSSTTSPPPTSGDRTASTQLHLSIGGWDSFQPHAQIRTDVDWVPEESEQQLSVAIRVSENVIGQVEKAEEDFNNAKRIRQQAQSELNNAIQLREETVKQIKAIKLQLTCHSCQRQLNAHCNYLDLFRQ